MSGGSKSQNYVEEREGEGLRKVFVDNLSRSSGKQPACTWAVGGGKGE